MKENSRTLYKQYKLEKKNLGGFFGRDGQGNFTNLDKMNRIGSFATGMIGALDPGDENGVQSDIGAGASGAISGAMALAPLGPVGLGIGAVLGGATSLFGNQKKKEEAEQRQMARNEKLADQKADEVKKQIALDPSKLGRNNVSMYKMGGTIMGKPAGKFALQGTLIGKYRAQQSLMPNISVRPNRMMAEGGTIDPPKKEKVGDKEKAYTAEYLKSKNFAKRISKGQYKDDYWTIKKERLDALKYTDVTDESIIPSLMGAQGSHNYLTKSITIGKTPKEYEDDPEYAEYQKGTVIAHELSHATGATNPQNLLARRPLKMSARDYKEIKSRTVDNLPDKFVTTKEKDKDRQKLNKEIEEFDERKRFKETADNLGYWLDPSEVKARMDALRYNLKRDGIYDSGTEDFTEEHYEKAKKLFGETTDFRSIKSKEDFIWLMNNIASNKSKKTMSKAEYGGLIKMANGGKINIDSSGRGVVEGPSHKNGGVKIPELGVELEGDETLDGDFVFSKKLGFAAQHKKLMKGIKGTQKDNTPLSIYTRKKLEEKEEMLKVKQEETKKSLGLPNEIDGQQTEEFAIGGSLPKKIYADYLGIPSGVTANTKVTIPTPPSSLNVAGDSSYNLSNTAPTGKSTFDKISDGFEKMTPFISNIANTFRKLPAVPDPILDDSIAPLYQDYSASRAEVARGVRGANKVAEQQLASSSATNATRAANLVAGFRATNEINQAQNNANVGIANQTINQNAEIKRNNNTKLEYKASQDVARSLKQQELNSENLANFTDKLQLQTRDNNLRSLEDDKLMLQIAQDNTGASWRAGKDIFKRRLTPESFKALDEKMSNLEKLSKEERELTIKALQNGLSSLGNSPALNRSPLVEYKKKK